jgi:hypothetical protein
MKNLEPDHPCAGVVVLYSTLNENELVDQFMEWCEAKQLNAQETPRILNAQEALEDEEHVTIPAFTFSDDV